MSRLRDELLLLPERPCASALRWVEDRTREEAWAMCPVGPWLLWYLEARGVDCIAASYWCAERARRIALHIMAPSRERVVLATCAPITDRDTAWAAEAAARAAAKAVSWMLLGTGAAVATQAAARSAWEATAVGVGSASWAAAEAVVAVFGASQLDAAFLVEAEERAIADYVRAHYQLPAPIEGGT